MVSYVLLGHLFPDFIRVMCRLNMLRLFSWQFNKRKEDSSWLLLCCFWPSRASEFNWLVTKPSSILISDTITKLHKAFYSSPHLQGEVRMLSTIWQLGEWKKPLTSFTGVEEPRGITFFVPFLLKGKIKFCIVFLLSLFHCCNNLVKLFYLQLFIVIFKGLYKGELSIWKVACWFLCRKLRSPEGSKHGSLWANSYMCQTSC